MRYSKANIVRTIALTCALSTSMMLTAFADSDDEDLKAISKVTVDIDYSLRDSGGDMDVKAGSNQYSIDGYYVNNEPDEEWKKYDAPEVIIELSANDGYYFNKTSAGYFKFNLDDGSEDQLTATFVSADRDDDKVYMEVMVLLPPKNGKLGNPYNLTWSEYGMARWDKGYAATKYTVTIHKDNSKIDTVETKDNRYDFAETIIKNGKGNYKFKVKAENSKTSGTTIESYEFTVDDSALQKLVNYNNNKSDGSYGPGGPSSSNNTETPPNPIDPTGRKPTDEQMNNANGPGDSGLAKGWLRSGETGKWWYRHHDLGWTSNDWEFIDNKWYHFDQYGWMQTGWIYLSNKWFYLNPSGDMAYGWVYTGDKWYYMDPNSGQMQTGYQMVNGKLYFLNDVTDGSNGKPYGSMYMNEKVPNGAFADASGAIH